MSSNVILPPPFYDDLGKSAKDLFSKGYNYDTVKLNVTTKVPTGAKFEFGGTSYIDSGKVLGTFQATHRTPKYGINNTSRWETNNMMRNETSCDLLKGAKFSIENTYSLIQTSYDKTWKLRAQYGNNYLALRTDADFKTSTGYTPLISSSGILQYGGYFLGLQSKFDTKDSKLKSLNMGVGYNSKEFAIHGKMSDQELYNCHIYHQVNPFLETGVEFSCSKENNDPKFGICCKYTWDRDTAVRAKVNNSSQIGLSFAHKLRDGITITLSALINGKNFNQGGHKIGLGIEFEPYCSHASSCFVK
ncbi:voltage-dependent anion-selective channel-like [Planococcus citri]|uniref:voltage-dependent anion-selective channel-like n=1 Tax=Planococcus citri TaxID=170843 RepID=UPI0031F8C81E